MTTALLLTCLVPNWPTARSGTTPTLLPYPDANARGGPLFCPKVCLDLALNPSPLPPLLTPTWITQLAASWPFPSLRTEQVLNL